MRIDSAVSVFLLVVLAAAPAVPQERSSSSPTDSHPTILDVGITETPNSVDVVVRFSQLVQPEVRRLDHPDRLIFDFPGCELGVRGQRFHVSQEYILAVNTTASSSMSPGASIIVDLAPPRGESASVSKKLVVSLNAIGNDLVIRFGGSEPPVQPSPVSSEKGLARQSLPNPAPGRVADRAVIKGEATPAMPSLPADALATHRPAPKTPAAVPPIPSVETLAHRNDRTSEKTADAVVEPITTATSGLGTKRTTSTNVEVIQPIPTTPPNGFDNGRRTNLATAVVLPSPSVDRLVSRNDRASPSLSDPASPIATPPSLSRKTQPDVLVSTEPVPAMPSLARGPVHGAPETAADVPPVSNLPIGAAHDETILPKVADAAPPTSIELHSIRNHDRAASVIAGPTSTLVSPHLAGGANTQLRAYALLDKARSLTVEDLEPLEAKAETDDPESETMLALAYHAGTLLKVNDAEALSLLTRAASHGFVAAEEAMGIFCQSGFGMTPDKQQAVFWYTKAAQHGSRDAATNLALMYATGDGVEKDTAKAAIWFRSAAEAGDATAQINLAALYSRGDVLPRDGTQAVFWLTKAADQGLVSAMVELARWLLNPEHGGNVDAAMNWFEKAADLGDETAQVDLGDIFVDQKLGRLDYAKALHWYRKAADQNYPGGQFGLGARYLFGQGVPQDMQEARRWLTPAANRGHPNAQFLLATMLEKGQGGQVDVANAVKYYEPAANYGIAQAQYHLGLLLATDQNKGDNLVAAYKWLILARDVLKQDDKTAEQLRTLLTPAQLAQAENQITAWRTAHFPRLNR